MKYRLNQLPVKTTNGFKINDVEVDLELPTYNMLSDYKLDGDISLLKIKKEIVENTITSKIGLDIHKYYELNITIPKNVIIEKPIFITYDFKSHDALYSKFNFLFEENSSCNFIIAMNSSDHNKHFNYFIESVKSKHNSNGSITIINHLNQNSINLYALENDVLENASITHSIFDLNGKTRLYNIYSNLLNNNSNNIINTIYIGKDDSLLDFNYYTKSIGEYSNSQIKVEGVLTDHSHKNFRGTIDFQKGCSQSIGEENENCILLTDTCRSRSLPQMLCGEEDVIGTHGVASGKVPEEKLFYLMSRGYCKREAERLLVLGRLQGIVEEIPDEDTKSVILASIEELLS